LILENPCVLLEQERFDIAESFMIHKKYWDFNLDLNLLLDLDLAKILIFTTVFIDTFL
jgi:hypothetical protein